MSLIQTLPTLGKITFKISHQFKIILISVQLKLAEKDMIVDILTANFQCFLHNLVYCSTANKD